MQLFALRQVLNYKIVQPPAISFFILNRLHKLIGQCADYSSIGIPMGKLSSFQRQVQNTVDSTIKKTEKTYLSLAAKPFELSSKFHSLHDDSVAHAADALRKLNRQFGEIGLKLISKIEKEETKTERAKRVISNAGKKTRKNVTNKANAARKAVKSQTEKVEEAFG